MEMVRLTYKDKEEIEITLETFTCNEMYYRSSQVLIEYYQD